MSGVLGCATRIEPPAETRMVDAQRWACVAPRRVVCGPAETACALCAVAGARSESSFVRYGSIQRDMTRYGVIECDTRKIPSRSEVYFVKQQAPGTSKIKHFGLFQLHWTPYLRYFGVNPHVPENNSDYKTKTGTPHARCNRTYAYCAQHFTNLTLEESINTNKH
jgi:hypothetical protein